ncbi:hypothetical protein HBB16_18210 [Pseudonocardia sp. MCCB 268]|nr:hypothetical protein [Pseudonocardia cytotoxica]
MLLLNAVRGSSALIDTSTPAFTSLGFCRGARQISFLLFAGGSLASLLFVGTLPRLQPIAGPERTRLYRLYGLHHWAHRVIAGSTSRSSSPSCSGTRPTSSATCRWIGYRLTPVVQTGSNFGITVQHEVAVPELGRPGHGRRRQAVAAQRRLLSAFQCRRCRSARTTSSATASPTRRRGRTGDNCLLATKVMVPIDGPVGRRRAAQLAQLRDPHQWARLAPGAAARRAAPPAGLEGTCAPAASCSGCWCAGCTWPVCWC